MKYFTLPLFRFITPVFAFILMFAVAAFAQGDRPMLEQIEKGVLAHLEAKVLMPARQMIVEKTGAGGTGAKSLSVPSLGVAIEAGRLTPNNALKTVFRNDLRLFVYLDFSSLRDEAAVRHGLYPFVLSTMSFLSGQDLGLNISPLVPVQFQNTTEQADMDLGRMNFMIEFSTSYYFNRLDDEAASTLLRAGIDYLLKPGDDEADMQGRVGENFPS